MSLEEIKYTLEELKTAIRSIDTRLENIDGKFEKRLRSLENHNKSSFLNEKETYDEIPTSSSKVKRINNDDSNIPHSVINPTFETDECKLESAAHTSKFDIT